MRAITTTWATAWSEAWSNRRGFWTQVSLMFVNDTVWIVFWVLFFRRVGQVRGWDIGQVLVLFAVLTTSAGFVLGMMNNARRIGQLAADGELDSALSLPVPTLPHLLVRRIETLFVGDLFFGLAIFALFSDRSASSSAATRAASSASMPCCCSPPIRWTSSPARQRSSSTPWFRPGSLLRSRPGWWPNSIFDGRWRRPPSA